MNKTKKYNKRDKRLNEFFVYAYLDPRKECNILTEYYNFNYIPFYIGKGVDKRYNDHINEYNRFYKWWVEKYGKEIADKKLLEWIKISNQSKCKKIYVYDKNFQIISEHLNAIEASLIYKRAEENIQYYCRINGKKIRFCNDILFSYHEINREEVIPC